ncbi:hypothetical protein V5799_000541 [Amblyomma americanum]|uniref:Secreted protein n=1 Tax=Amblyomma americanum TaxID=6943 RepID=A0AAQ4D2T3_AMBAM
MNAVTHSAFKLIFFSLMRTSILYVHLVNAEMCGSKVCNFEDDCRPGSLCSNTAYDIQDTMDGDARSDDFADYYDKPMPNVESSGIQLDQASNARGVTHSSVSYDATPNKKKELPYVTGTLQTSVHLEEAMSGPVASTQSSPTNNRSAPETSNGFNYAELVGNVSSQENSALIENGTRGIPNDLSEEMQPLSASAEDTLDYEENSGEETYESLDKTVPIEVAPSQRNHDPEKNGTQEILNENGGAGLKDTAPDQEGLVFQIGGTEELSNGFGATAPHEPASGTPGTCNFAVQRKITNKS